MTDEQKLVQSAAAGDREAFEQLVLTYQKQVYNLALRMCGNPDDALDLSQEAFLNAWKGLKSFQFDAAFSTWLYRLTSNVCISFLRSKKRRHEVSMTVLNKDDEDEELALPDPGPVPEELTLRSEDRERLSQALQELEFEHRQALWLSVYAGQSYAQIAEIQGVKEGTVKSRIARAREKLRKKWLQSGNDSVTAASKKQEGGDADAEL